MAKLTLEADETRLKKKVAGKPTGEEKAAGDTAGRGLRKQLKRVQRKRRRLALRKQHAKGKQPVAANQPAAAAG